ncbi:hypothetical protein HK097_008849 [Rhizophlyctis rosea]|uniref:Uncharacterized protein n=1 Tax=Rhizophlyctis rosea TaxID=64517 RepID=A0AAD5SCI6_9FUNG|nr:hypothetical protein HK097_008849 [Rhizophlyctis rosea]
MAFIARLSVGSFSAENAPQYLQKALKNASVGKGNTVTYQATTRNLEIRNANSDFAILPASGGSTAHLLAGLPKKGESGAMVYYEPQGGWLDIGRSVSEIHFSLLRASNLEPVNLNSGILSASLAILTDENDVTTY